jgi:L-iditol 2-dehydrogenase
MRAAVLVSPGRIELQEVETPHIGDQEVLVKTKYCGICTFEQRLFSGDMKFSYPVIPGHEASGEVVEVGRRVLSGLKPGIQVALDLVTRCGECHYCRTGRSNMCLDRFKPGKRTLGGFGEYIAVDSRQVFPLPGGLSLAEAAFAEPVACCLRSLKMVQPALGEDLLVVGAGPMGLMHVQAALCMGVRVIVSDPNATRLAVAEGLGASRTVNPRAEDLGEVVRDLTEGRGVDACILTSPAADALRTAFEVLSKTGRINIYTSYPDQPVLPIDANTLHRSEIHISGSEGRTEQDFHQSVRLLAIGRIRVRALISELVSLGEAERGIRLAMSQDTLRVLLDHDAVGSEACGADAAGSEARGSDVRGAQAGGAGTTGRGAAGRSAVGRKAVG